MAPAVRHALRSGGICPATSVAIILGGAVAAGFADGHVRVFRVGAGAAAFCEVEAAAHARAVTALATHPSLPTFASVSEDGTACVWSLPAVAAAAVAGGGTPAAGGSVGRIILDMAARQEANCVPTGAAFVTHEGGRGVHLAVTSYDAMHLRVFLGR